MTYQLHATPKRRNLPSTLLLIAALSVLGFAGYFMRASATQPAPALSYGQRRAQIALAEYHKGVAETTPGCNCGPRVDLYTQGSRHQWCAMFASWVALQAGAPVHSDKTNSWRIPKSRDFAKYLQQHGTWHSRKEIQRTGVTPQIGDFMIYWRGEDYDDNLGHIEIVTNPSIRAGTASMVGGNINHKVYVRDVAYAQRDKLLGFGHPEK